jgi:hypothetical protein
MVKKGAIDHDQDVIAMMVTARDSKIPQAVPGKKGAIFAALIALAWAFPQAGVITKIMVRGSPPLRRPRGRQVSQTTGCRLVSCANRARLQ